MNKPKVFIYVEGGVIQTITSDQEIDFMVLDGDVDGIDGTKTYTDSLGNDFEAREVSDIAEVSQRTIDNYFSQKA